MDAELVEAIGNYVSMHPDTTVLDPDESERLRLLTAEQFDIRNESVWWWECLPDSAIHVPYDDQDGLDIALKIIPETSSRLILFVTDDSCPPWTCVSGTASGLVDMLREQRFFEYLIVNSTMDWILFDTHHNSIVILGEGLSVPSRG
ncbi:MAG: hypothetical protein JNL79_39390 [Myxococcales bacterium]|nr:hypothetical protein [Myxococcales bacterium]